MPDNPTSVESPALPLTDHRLLALTGKDALAFAQAQFMNDVTALADGAWQWNGWLTPKGRMVALFALLKLDAESLWLLLPDYSPDALAEGLKKYVFRSKLALTPRPDLQVTGIWDAASEPALREFRRTDQDVISLDWPSARRIDIRPAPAAVTPSDDAAVTLWRETDLRAGIPRLVESQSAQWTPQQLSLDRLRAYSVKKGCYPGQEIVARTHFLGQAKRVATLLEVPAGSAAGDEVRKDGQAIGTLASVAGTLALAVLPLEIDNAGLGVADGAATVLPFIEGLAR